MNDALSIPEYYTRKQKDKRTESQKLKKLAKSITKVPDTIKIPSEYLTGGKM